MLSFPYILIVGKILTNKNLSYLDKLIAGLLNTKMDIHSLTYISIEEIAEILNINSEEVKKSLESLEEYNFIEVSMVDIGNCIMLEIINK